MDGGIVFFRSRPDCRSTRERGERRDEPHGAKNGGGTPLPKSKRRSYARGGLGNTKPRFGAAKTETSAAIAEVATKIEHLQRESEAKLSEVSERFDRIEHEIAGLLAAAPVAGGSASAAPVARKRAQGGRGDAFDPSQNPTAPGGPHPLGSLAPAASANNAAAETAYRQRTN
jgi:hypothetical protein